MSNNEGMRTWVTHTLTALCGGLGGALLTMLLVYGGLRDEASVLRTRQEANYATLQQEISDRKSADSYAQAQMSDIRGLISTVIQQNDKLIAKLDAHSEVYYEQTPPRH